MGASGWIEFVPYDPDFNEALWRLRRATFLAGRYEGPSDMSGEEAAEMTDEQVQAAMADFLGIDPSELEGLRHEMAETMGEPPGRPVPRDELDEKMGRMLNMTFDQGSHSILDVSHVADQPAFGVVVPIQDADLKRLLGTTRPTRTQIKEAEEALLQLRDRWEGSLIVAHDDTGKPVELCFLGYSGD